MITIKHNKNVVIFFKCVAYVKKIFSEIIFEIMSIFLK